MSDRDDPQSEFVCYPVTYGVGYIHPLDILSIVDIGSNQCHLVIRTAHTQPTIVEVTCSATELHHRRMDAFHHIHEKNLGRLGRATNPFTTGSA